MSTFHFCGDLMSTFHFRFENAPERLCGSIDGELATAEPDNVTCDRCLAMLSLRHGGEGTLAGAVDTLMKELREKLAQERVAYESAKTEATSERHMALEAERVLQSERVKQVKELALRVDEVAALRADFDRKLEAQTETVKALEASLEAQRSMVLDERRRADMFKEEARELRRANASMAAPCPTPLAEELRVAGNLLEIEEARHAAEEAMLVEALRAMRVDRDDRKNRLADVVAALSSHEDYVLVVVREASRDEWQEGYTRLQDRIDRMRTFASAWSKDK